MQLVHEGRAFISVEDVSKVYEGARGGIGALRGVSLRIEKGDFVAIMGSSGSGKTTLLSVLGAMNPPTQGKVVVDEIDLYSLSGDKLADFRHRYLGFVFQQSHLIPYLTAVENVMVPLVVGDGEEARLQVAARALGSVGLKERMLQLPDQLSGGEQGRVAIARAVVNNPPILLADEPTGNLDSRTGEEIMNLLRALNEKGHTVLMVTHSQEAAGFAHRIVVLRDGVVVEERRGAAPASNLAAPQAPALESLAGAWAQQADQAALEAEEADEEADGYGEWLLITAITFVAGVVLMLIIFVLQPDSDLWQHVH